MTVPLTTSTPTFLNASYVPIFIQHFASPLLSMKNKKYLPGDCSGEQDISEFTKHDARWEDDSRRPGH